MNIYLRNLIFIFSVFYNMDYPLTLREVEDFITNHPSLQRREDLTILILFFLQKKYYDILNLTENDPYYNKLFQKLNF
jgi:hypothetical protein